MAILEMVDGRFCEIARKSRREEKKEKNEEG
jgi:hypothetical protein